MDERLFHILSHHDTAEQIVLTELEWVALLFVPLADVTDFDITQAIQALVMADVLVANMKNDKAFAPARSALIRGLAFLSRLPGGVQFGRLHFGNDEEWTITT